MHTRNGQQNKHQIKQFEEQIEELQRQVNQLTATNLLLEDQLARKEQFTAMIAHELRSPLTPIINYAQIVARPNQRRETIERGTNIITSQAWRLTRLINDLLDSSRLSTGQFTLSCSPCDLVALVKEVVEQLRPVAPYHSFALDLPETPVIGTWDNVRLQQALGNLVDNAIKYSDEETTITVRAWQTPGKAHVSVHNMGVCIPSGDIDQLFRPFSRLPGSGSQRGTGLGLYITKCIVEAHGGELRLERAENEFDGTTFSFDLPV
jgi:signal transduction histidine kinase